LSLSSGLQVAVDIQTSAKSLWVKLPVILAKVGQIALRAQRAWSLTNLAAVLNKV
jgi:hypothetical protein